MRSVSSGGSGGGGQLLGDLAGHFQDCGFYSERSRWEPEDVKGFCNCTGSEYDPGY